MLLCLNQIRTRPSEGCKRDQDSADQPMLFAIFNYTVLVSPRELQPQSLPLRDAQPGPLLQQPTGSSTWLCFGDAALHSSLASAACLSYCRLPLFSSQSVHSPVCPLTSVRHFPPHCCSLESFPLFSLFFFFWGGEGGKRPSPKSPSQIHSTQCNCRMRLR